MKRRPTRPFHLSAGFTLVELLVVVVIIAALAALGFTVGPKMLKRGQAAKSIQNMRQIGSMMGVYMVDSSNRLPVAKQVIKNPSGGTSDVHWHQLLLAQMYPEVDTAKFNDRKWWESNKPIFRNPLITATTKPLAFAPWFPGYAYNMGINYNVTGSWDWSAAENAPQSMGISLSKIPEPARTPLIGTRANWHYSGKELTTPEVKSFLVDGKLPILFVDGHVESMTQNEYLTRRLEDMPKL